jgi:hypothetical protein
MQNPFNRPGRGGATVEKPAVDQPQGQLEATRLAIASLLAVITDEQFTAVEAALEAVEAMSDMAAGALKELRLVHSRRDAVREQDQMLRALDARLTMRDKHR